MTIENSLTAQQEQFITMLISGETISSIATELGVNRSTLYAWRDLETVQARYNELVTEVKGDLESGLLGLYSQAVGAVKECLESENDHTKLKVALWLIERAEQLKPGVTDPAALVRQNHTTTTSALDSLVDFGESTELDQAAYNHRMKELGLAS